MVLDLDFRADSVYSCPACNVDLTSGSGDDVREKSHMVHKDLSFINDILRQQPLSPNRTTPLGEAHVPVEKRLLVHSNFTDFWRSHNFAVQAGCQGFSLVDMDGKTVEIGRQRRNITWRRSTTGYGPKRTVVQLHHGLESRLNQ